MSISFSTTQIIVVGAIILLSAIIAGWKIGSWIRSYCARRRMSRGLDMEKKAGAFLRSKGYRVLSYQKQLSYQLLIGDEAVNVTLKLDFVVGKNGMKYVAEVKSGKQAPDIRTPATRRQLLEYSLVAEADGILLVNMETKQISEVLFPFARTASTKRLYLLLWLSILGLLAYLISLIW